jgi:hypothetical protein
MTTNQFRPEDLLTRERTMCTICYSERKGWVRIAHLGDRARLVSQYGEALGGRKYRALIRAAARKHLTEMHPQIHLRP